VWCIYYILSAACLLLSRSPRCNTDDDDDAWEAIFKKQSDELLENNNGGGIPFSTRFAHPNDPEDRKYAWYRVIREYNRSKTEPAEAQQ